MNEKKTLCAVNPSYFWYLSTILGGRVYPIGTKQQGGCPEAVAEGETAHAGHSPPAERADDGG